MTNADVDRAINILRALGATIPNTPQVREVMKALLEAQMNKDVDNTTLPLKLGSVLSE
jgi:hypothetical protein